VTILGILIFTLLSKISDWVLGEWHESSLKWGKCDRNPDNLSGFNRGLAW
jgi:hypothetical protein